MNHHVGTPKCINQYPSFIPYKELTKRLLLQTKVHFPDNVGVLTQDIEVCRVPILRIVPNNMRKWLFVTQLNCLYWLNPDLSLMEAKSFIHFWNQHQTISPLPFSTETELVEKEYERLKLGGANKAKIKLVRVHTNPAFGNRKKLANQANGELRVKESLEMIEKAVEYLNDNGLKISLNNIAEVLKGCLAIASIKRHWRLIVPKNNDPQDKQNEKSMDNSSKNKTVNKGQEKMSKYAQHILADGTPIWNIQYFIDHHKMDAEFAEECYHSQFRVDMSKARNRTDYEKLKAKQEELDGLVSYVT